MPISNELGDDSSRARVKRGAADRMAVETAENRTRLPLSHAA